MSKPWVGLLAAGLIFLSGVLEMIGGNIVLGIFLMVLSFVSFGLRVYINKKARERDKNSGL